MKSSTRTGRTKISYAIQKWLLLVVMAVFLIIIALTFALQTQLAVKSADEMLFLNIRDTQSGVEIASDQFMLDWCSQIAVYESPGGLPALSEIQREQDVPGGDINAYLVALTEVNYLSEINIIDKNGIITYSTYPDFIGFDMKQGADTQAGDFYHNLLTKDYYVQDYREVSHEIGFDRKYAGMRLPEECFFSGGIIQVGFDAEQVEAEIAYQMQNVTASRHVGETGRLFVCKPEETGWMIISETGRNLITEAEDRYIEQETGLSVQALQASEQNVRFEADIYGESCYCMYAESDGYYVIAALPKSEALVSRDMSVRLMAVMDVLVFIILFALIYILINKLVVKNVRRVNAALDQITGGNLDVKVDVQTNEEFYSLSEGINATVSALKGYIADAEARIAQELAYAKEIQLSALPSVFPPYPERHEFDIYASMQAAKEVGGDFYDFYLLGGNRLAFVAADVSGKGIPAAMFMMTTKTLIKSLAESGMEVNDIFTKANERLCEDNEAGMFVTAWMGILNLETGMMRFANAGHNPPLLKRADGDFEYLRTRAGFVLAGMEGIRYRAGELQLMPGDMLYLYTDGVTEATDAENRLYGEARLQNAVNENKTAGVKELCLAVKRDVDAFAGEAPQFDDITMLALTFHKTEMEYMDAEPELENIGAVTGFLEKIFEEAGVPAGIVTKFSIAVDEVFSNIVLYSGATEIKVGCSAKDGKAVLRFTDNGKPYDPTRQEDPDITLAAEERPIGGLGIFMVKKMMDSVVYENIAGINSLTLEKSW